MYDSNGVVCYWEHQPKERKQWKLFMSYLIDSDGHGISKNAPHGRNAYDLWLSGDPTGENSYCTGRAVTLWSLEHGVTLLGFNPHEAVSWLSPNFDSNIRKRPDWMNFFSDTDLWFGTLEEASKYIKISNPK